MRTLFVWVPILGGAGWEDESYPRPYPNNKKTRDWAREKGYAVTEVDD